MNQRELILKVNEKSVSEEVISKCNSWRAALKLCKEVSGLTDDQICQELEIAPAQWSRIWSAQANFPDDKLEKFMILCGNLVPLRWLAMRFGRGLHLLQSEIELELAEEIQKRKQAEDKLATITEFMKATGR